MNLQLIVKDKKEERGIFAASSTAVFAGEVNSAVVHQVVTAYQANSRAQSYGSTEASSRTPWKKSRSAVSGGGRKPRPQKGSGRARAGTIRSPLWVGGGMTFGSSIPNYTQKINKKMYRIAMRSILSALHQSNRLAVATIELPDYKTKSMIQWFADHGIAERALIVLADINEEIFLAARNLPNVLVVLTEELNPVLLLKYDTVLVQPEAVAQIEGIFA
jgi:large subunit ribosomal protein L4